MLFSWFCSYIVSVTKGKFIPTACVCSWVRGCRGCSGGNGNRCCSFSQCRSGRSDITTHDQTDGITGRAFVKVYSCLLASLLLLLFLLLSLLLVLLLPYTNFSHRYMVCVESRQFTRCCSGVTVSHRFRSAFCRCRHCTPSICPTTACPICRTVCRIRSRRFVNWCCLAMRSLLCRLWYSVCVICSR